MSATPEGKAPWYAAGLRFRCTACGVCCTGEPGHVWIEDADVQRMAAALGITPKRFLKRYTRRVGRRTSLREQSGGDCILLEDGRCTVYTAKPTRCSTFPFWSDVLDSPEEWAEAAERCEGIGQGDLYDVGEIRRLTEGDASPLFEKHARAPDPTPAEPDWEAAFAALQAVYDELDEELPRYRFTCSASGRCCDFDAYGHRLYLTTLEAEMFFRNGPADRANDDPRHCPAWGPDRLCNAREHRMLGCRTYYCPPYPAGVPEELHERYFRRIKALHVVHGIPYAYRDVVDWAAERRPASR